METTLNRQASNYVPFLLLTAAILVIFVARTALAAVSNPLRLDDLFTLLTLGGSLVVLASGGFRRLRLLDWATALGLAALVGVSLYFATLGSAYPFLGRINGPLGQALARGFCALLAALGGLAVMHQGGPVQSLAAAGAWRKTAGGVLFGLAVGLPLAAINVVALQFTQGQGIQWQSPLAAMLDSLRPAVLEEVIYRFALWGLLWLALRASLGERAAFLAGLLATLVHAYIHFDELFLQAPFVALGMGLVMTLLWGLPPLLLARRRGLESAIAFHWLQDVARFVAGF